MSSFAQSKENAINNIRKKYSNKIYNKLSDKNENNIEINKTKFIGTINLRMFQNIDNIDYLSNNIYDFFSYYVTIFGSLPSNMKIVSHSKTMKNFYNFLQIEKKDKFIFKLFSIKKEKNNIEKLQFDENIWSLLMRCNNKSNIIITRHAYTVANFYINSSSIIKQVLERDTKLTVYGILTSLLKGNKLKEKNNDCNIIFVSVLIRTWMTAICLYLPHCNSKFFTLIVSPFLKEEGNTYDNLP